MYQTSGGGKTYCPLDREARIVSSSTPRFAKTVSHKAANNPITVVQRDLDETHGRKVSREFVHQLSEAVGAIAQLKEESWEYETPKLERPIASVAVGIDGTCMFLSNDGWREALAGTISLYDEDGERQHTIYIGGAPEYGKATSAGAWRMRSPTSRRSIRRQPGWALPTAPSATGPSLPSIPACRYSTSGM